MVPGNRTFDRPHRTRLMKLINWIGRHHPPRHWSAEEIVHTAARRTGVEAWDDHSFFEPLGILMKSLEEEAELTAVGTLLIRATLINLVMNQISLQDWVRRHPEILDEPLRRPLVIVGLPRTGSTLLYNLLAQHPQARPLMMWESVRLQPKRAVPPGRRDSRKARARFMVRTLHRIAPQLRTIHPMDPGGPEECTALMMQTFVSPAFSMAGRVHSYLDWLRAQDTSFIQERYGHYRRSLQMLQWERTPRHWVLKSPAHIGMESALLSALPEANVIQVHRDLNEVLPSMGSLTAVFRGIYSDDVRPEDYGEEEVEDVSSRVQECMATREKHPGRILDLRYTELIRDPLGTARNVYHHFGYEWDNVADTRTSTWVQARSKKERGEHKYDLAQFGLSTERIEEMFGDYMDAFVRG